MDILDKLRNLEKQATTERSHFYVASCCREAIEEIIKLRNKQKMVLHEAEKMLELIEPLRRKK